MTAAMSRLGESLHDLDVMQTQMQRMLCGNKQTMMHKPRMLNWRIFFTTVRFNKTENRGESGSGISEGFILWKTFGSDVLLMISIPICSFSPYSMFSITISSSLTAFLFSSSVDGGVVEIVDILFCFDKERFILVCSIMITLTAYQMTKMMYPKQIHMGIVNQ